MISAACTLFEGHYHYGVAALINSLYNQGYRGEIYVGYRGLLPIWSSEAKENTTLSWHGAYSLSVAKELEIHFLPIETEFHLTNYKPFFMMRLIEIFSNKLDSLIYFDPDITIKCRWDFFGTWTSRGVALVHEINSNDMPPTHPIRMGWKDVIIKSGRQVTRELHSYINGGFCGVSKKNTEFLKTWTDITTTAIQFFGLTPGQWSHNFDRSFLFYAQDQDTLNIAAMCSKSSISEMGPEAMDFIHGGFTMSHSVGSPKPWENNFILSLIAGRSPSAADKAYWYNVDGPIKLYSSKKTKLKRAVISSASFISRFYGRS